MEKSLYFIFRAESALIETLTLKLYVSKISLFFNFYSRKRGGGGAYSILLGKVGMGRLLGHGCLLGRIRYACFAYIPWGDNNYDALLYTSIHLEFIYRGIQG